MAKLNALLNLIIQYTLYTVHNSNRDLRVLAFNHFSEYLLYHFVKGLINKGKKVENIMETLDFMSAWFENSHFSRLPKEFFSLHLSLASIIIIAFECIDTVTHVAN